MIGSWELQCFVGKSSTEDLSHTCMIGDVACADQVGYLIRGLSIVDRILEECLMTGTLGEDVIATLQELQRTARWVLGVQSHHTRHESCKYRTLNSLSVAK